MQYSSWDPIIYGAKRNIRRAYSTYKLVIMDKSGQGMPTFGYIEPLNKSMVSPFLFFSLCVSATQPR